MSVRISLTLEASEMFLSHHMIFSLEKAAVVWAILERISGFDTSLEMIAPRYLKFSTASSLWHFYLGLSLAAIWQPSCPDQSPFCTLWCCIETVYQDNTFFFLFFIYNNVICKANIGNQSSSDADTTFMVIQCLTHDSL